MECTAAAVSLCSESRSGWLGSCWSAAMTGGAATADWTTTDCARALSAAVPGATGGFELLFKEFLRFLFMVERPPLICRDSFLNLLSPKV